MPEVTIGRINGCRRDATYLTFWLVEKIGYMARIALLPVDIRFA